MRAVARRVVLAVLVMFAGLACRGAAGADVIELRLWAMGREGEVVGQLVRDFERSHPGIRVRVQQIPWTAAHEKLLTAYVGDATPDIAQLGNTWIPEFAALDALEPLGSRASASAIVDESDYFEGIWATNLVSDTLYGVPWYVDTRVLFYRTDLLAEAGSRDVPSTWAEWRTAMERLKARMGPRRYPLLMPVNEWAPPVSFALQTGATLLRDEGRYGNFRGPRFRRAFEFYIQLYRDSLAGVLSNTEVSNLFQEFARGTIAMYITGPWNIGEFASRLPPALNDKWGTAPLPGPDGPGASMAGGASLVLFRQSPHKTEAWQLIEFLSRPEQQVRFYQLTGDLPPRRTAWSDSALASNQYALAFREQLERVRPLPGVPEIEQIVTKVMEYGEQVARRLLTVDQALTALDSDIDRLLEKRRWLLARR
jgi:multiple sugar transport system substrate-binding protein